MCEFKKAGYSFDDKKQLIKRLGCQLKISDISKMVLLNRIKTF